jgi:hypothetical protein
MKTIAQLAKIGPIWERCYDFKNIFAEKYSKKVGVLIQNKIKF